MYNSAEAINNFEALPTSSVDSIIHNDNDNFPIITMYEIERKRK